MDKPAEILLFDFLDDEISSAVPESVLFDLELHDTVYQSITKPRGIRISEAVGDLSPGPEMVIKEYDVSLIIICYSLVEGKQITQRQPALISVFQIQQAVYELLVTDSTLGGRVCDVLILKGSRGYDVFDEGIFAVANVPIIINPSGARYHE
jgi:hypothetical protein